MNNKLSATLSPRTRRLMEEEVVDPQVYMGVNLLGANSDIEVYKKHMRDLYIKAACIIPETTHELRLKNGTIEHSAIWSIDFRTGKPIYERTLIRDDKVIKLDRNPKHPYLYANRYTLEYIKRNNVTKNGGKFHFIPIVHPVLDKQYDLEELLNNEYSVAIKLHGLSTHTTPKQIPAWIPKLARKYDKPFIIHTDYYSKDINKAKNPELAKLMLANRPLYWVEWALNNGVRAFLAHGIRLDKEAGRLIGREEQFIVGTGPDFVINISRDRRFSSDKDYITTLLELLEPEKIAFASDFAWNWLGINKTKHLHWGSKRKIVDVAIMKGLTDKDIIEILRKGSQRFFAL